MISMARGVGCMRLPRGLAALQADGRRADAALLVDGGEHPQQVEIQVGHGSSVS
jgi:hypothetical protein